MTPKDLAEREGKPIALAWIDSALSALREEERSDPQNGESSVCRAALRINFAIEWPLTLSLLDAGRRLARDFLRDPRQVPNPSGDIAERDLVGRRPRATESQPEDPVQDWLRKHVPGLSHRAEAEIVSRFGADLRRSLLSEIQSTFERARGVIVASDRDPSPYFFDVEEVTAREYFKEGALPPAYAVFGRGVYFTQEFAEYDPSTQQGFGPMCRAAMVLHESVHVIDHLSGAPSVHISEWDEPRFSAQTIEQSIHNPSAYASFAAQVHERALDWPRDARYGAGRRAE